MFYGIRGRGERRHRAYLSRKIEDVERYKKANETILDDWHLVTVTVAPITRRKLSQKKLSEIQQMRDDIAWMHDRLDHLAHGVFAVRNLESVRWLLPHITKRYNLKTRRCTKFVYPPVT